MQIIEVIKIVNHSKYTKYKYIMWVGVDTNSVFSKKHHLFTDFFVSAMQILHLLCSDAI